GGAGRGDGPGAKAYVEREGREPEVRARVESVEAHRVEELARVLVAAEGGELVGSSMRNQTGLVHDQFLVLVGRRIDERRLHHLRLVEVGTVQEMRLQGTVQRETGQRHPGTKALELVGGAV